MEPQCAYFSFFTLSGLCHLSPASATKLQPVLNFVAGPRACFDHDIAREPEFEQLQFTRPVLGKAPAGLILVAAALTLALLCKRLADAKSLISLACSLNPAPCAQPDDAGSTLLEEQE